MFRVPSLFIAAVLATLAIVAQAQPIPRDPNVRTAETYLKKVLAANGASAPVPTPNAAEKAACRAKLVAICDGLRGVPHVTAELIEPAPVRGGFARARIRIERALGMTGYDFIWAMKTGRPSIHPGERELEHGAVVIHPFGLQDGDEAVIVRRVREIVGRGG